MKKILLLIAAVMTAMVMQAVPAYPYPVKVKQPDGTYVTIQLHGDEWMNFTTTEDGYSVVKDSRGYYVYAELKDRQLRPTAQIAHDALQRSASETAFLANVRKYQAPAMKNEMVKLKEQVQQQQRRALASRRTTDLNNFRGLVILVQFNDREFSRPDYPAIIDDMFNKEGYTGFDSEVFSGSVHDYFVDNSNGKFKPQFDIVGPVTVNFSQYYPHKVSNCQPIINAALDAVDDEVDFSQYDGDQNGKVDMVYFVIAGFGSHYGGNDEGLWWPHRSSILGDPVPDSPGHYYYKFLDGVQLWDYASSVELAGWTDDPSSVFIDGIGTICHEFGHVLGLPDFYDTDYEENGQSIHPSNWSVMAGGSYHNKARTPSGYSLYERYFVGFLDDIPLINEKNSFTLEPLYLNQKGYRIDSPVENEFFLLENRQNDGSYKWDSYLPGHGLLAYRVDRTNLEVWNANTVNAVPAHNYYEILWAGGSEHAVSGYDTYPGKGNVTELTNETSPANLLTHDGSETAGVLHDIQEVDGMIHFNVALGSAPVKPTHVTVNDITTTSATVTWAGYADDYELSYSEAPANAETCDPSWLQYDNGTYCTSLGYSTTYTGTWGVMYPGSQVTCSKLTKLSWFEIVGYLTSDDITVNIYSGGNNAPGTLLRSFTVSPGEKDGFHEVTLASPVTVTPGKNLWITLTATGTYSASMCYCSEPNNQWYFTGSSWINVGDAAPFFDDKGWMIRAYIEPVDLDEDAIVWNTQNISGSSINLTGLTPETTYLFKVRGDFGSDGKGPWTEINAFTTAINQLTLDENSVEPPVAGTVTNLKVNRTIDANQWSTICLPFAMSQAQFQNAFGNDAILKKYKGYTTTMEGGKPTAIFLKFEDFEWTDAETKTVAGTPYLIRTTKDIESFNVNNVTISTKLNHVSAGDTKNKFTGRFKGVLGKTTVPKKGLFISDNKFYYSTGKSNMKAFRGWFELEAKVDDAASAPVFFSFDGETTGIENIQRTTVGDDKYYNLNGQRVEHLKKGQIYIKNNKKVVVK